MTRTRSKGLSLERDLNLPTPDLRTQDTSNVVNQLAPATIVQPDTATIIDPELLDWEYDATLAGRTNYTDEAIEEMIEFEDARTTRRSNLTQASSTLQNIQSLASSDHSST